MYIINILVNTLGKDSYGVVALFTSLNQYIGLFLVAISGTIFRFISLEYHQSNNSISINKYYSTSFFSMLLLSIFAFSVLYFSTPLLKQFVNSSGTDFSEITLFFVLSILSFFISNLTAVFFVPTIIKHKFYLNDLSKIIAKVIQLLVILILVYYLADLSLYTYGISLIIYSVIFLSISIIFSKKIMPDLVISIRFFSFSYLRNMLKMGINVLLNNLGILLYTSTDLIIINIFLGTAIVAEYSIGLQLAVLISMTGMVFSRLFNPLIAKLIAKNGNTYIISQILINSKIFMIYIGLFFLLLITFSKQILFFWLGSEYVYLYPVVISLALYQLLHQSTVLFYMYFTLVNKLKIPLIVTILSGVLNIILSILLVKFTSYGIFAIIAATIITVFFKTVLFNSFYTAHLLNMKLFKILQTYLPSFIFITIYTSMCFLLIDSLDTHSLYIMSSSLLAIMLSYFLFAYYIIFTKKEKVHVLHLTKLYNLVRSKS